MQPDIYVCVRLGELRANTESRRSAHARVRCGPCGGSRLIEPDNKSKSWDVFSKC